MSILLHKKCILFRFFSKYIQHLNSRRANIALTRNIALKKTFAFQAAYLFKKNPEGKMFEPDYTETMSMLLDTVGRQQSDVLPQKGLESDVALFLKERDELSTVKEIEKSGTQNVCEEIKTALIPEQISDYGRIGSCEKKISNLANSKNDRSILKISKL